MTEFQGTPDDLEYLLSTQAIRERCDQVFEAAQNGKTGFAVNMDALPEIARFVAQVTRENYPKLNVPFHSRWKHFNAGGVDRLRSFHAAIAQETPENKLKIKTDLVIVSVLLDAGAGMQWSYIDAGQKAGIGKSEGLAVASFRAFQAGMFSSNPKAPFRVDAKGLQNFGWEKFRSAFQIAYNNPLEGDKGRYDLLKSLGRLLEKKPEFFGSDARLGNIASQWFGKKEMPATHILRTLQDGLGAIWPGRVSLNGYNLGDVWPCPALGEGLSALVPFHKLSQWLSYSLLDPILEAGVHLTGITDLTGLAEYRNGGLLVDMGALTPRDEKALRMPYKTSDAFIVEWRALTLATLSRLAPLVRKELNLTEDKLPLGKVLEGGTWWAGRRVAASKRNDGASPIKIISDGTVF